MLSSALRVLGLLGGCGAAASAAPLIAIFVLAPASMLAGVALARAHARKSVRALVVHGDSVSLDGTELDRPTWSWRGPLAQLRWRDANGGKRTLVWWPDTLPPAARRELKLALARRGGGPRTASMAP